MNSKKQLSFSFLMFFSLVIFAQFPRFNAEVLSEGDKFDFAFVGGLISPQFSEIDLNDDGTEDLFIFDKAGNVSLTFINNGTPNEVDYTYAPYYERFFPNMTDWVLLRDYDGDGIKDIFTYSDAPGIDGVIVFRGKYVGGAIAFDRYDFTNTITNNTIPFPAGNGFTQIYVTEQDYPAIDDIDGDGDLDILTFAVGGGHVYLFDNQSVEMGYGSDSLIYILGDDCWGRFYESGIAEPLSLSNDIDMCSNGFHDDTPEDGDARHVGSTLLTLDTDEDGIKELILGDISFNNLLLARNEGTTDVAFMTTQDTFFPSYDVSADIQIFPASFYMDVNNDGAKDLFASPNVWKPGENHEVVWYYKNNGATNNPDFQLIKKDFMVDEMIDIGKEAHPTFVDYNGDGLMDMVVGNSTFYRPFGERASRIFLYENIGTANNPKFDLVDEDYLDFSIFDDSGNNSPVPTFGDLDNDGDMDILIGEEGGGFYYGQNIAGPGNTIDIPSIQFGFMGLDLGARTVPQLVDLNRDGKLDIVSGVKTGRLVYLQNEGTPEVPMFIPNVNTDSAAGNNTVFLGQVDTRLGEFSGYSAPFFYDFGDDFGLFTGSNLGNILRYSDIDGNLEGAFTLESELYGESRAGFLTVPTLIDINNDGRLEMFVGNSRGGVTAYKTNVNTDGTPVSSSEPLLATNDLVIYPNPTRDFINLDIRTINPFTSAKIRVFNAIGQLVYSDQLEHFQTTVSTSRWGKGMFVIQVEAGDQTMIEKVIVQ